MYITVNRSLQVEQISIKEKQKCTVTVDQFYSKFFLHQTYQMHAVLFTFQHWYCDNIVTFSLKVS